MAAVLMIFRSAPLPLFLWGFILDVFVQAAVLDVLIFRAPPFPLSGHERIAKLVATGPLATAVDTLFLPKFRRAEHPLPYYFFT